MRPLRSEAGFCQVGLAQHQKQALLGSAASVVLGSFVTSDGFSRLTGAKAKHATTSEAQLTVARDFAAIHGSVSYL